jgi:hypothetical protein
VSTPQKLILQTYICGQRPEESVLTICRGTRQIKTTIKLTYVCDDFHHHLLVKETQCFRHWFFFVTRWKYEALFDPLDANIKVQITFKNPFHTFQEIHDVFITKSSQLALYAVMTAIYCEDQHLFLCVGFSRVCLIFLSGSGNRAGVQNAVSLRKMKQWIMSNVPTSLKQTPLSQLSRLSNSNV